MQDKDICETVWNNSLQIGLNSPRRQVIGRTAIFYGQTPIGIQKKQVEEMAAEINMNMEDFCKKIISSNESQLFLLLKTYYEKSDPTLFASFFKNFNTKLQSEYKAHMPNINSNASIGKNKRNYEISPRGKINKLSRRDTDVAGPSGKQNDNIRACQIIAGSEMTIHTKVKESETSSLKGLFGTTDFEKSSPVSLCHTKTHNTSAFKESDHKNLTDIHKNNSSKIINMHLKSEQESQSVITSILFDDSDSKLKKIIQSKSRKQSSPRKYDTILESLLYE